MKEAEKALLEHWKTVLKDHLDPLEMMESLPDVFIIGTEKHTKVMKNRKKTHDAVEIIINECANSDIQIEEFTGAMRRCGHGWLAALVSGEIEAEEVERAVIENENREFIRKYLTIISPLIKSTINAKEVAVEMGERITKDEFELIECRAREDGNREAVRFLLSILIRKPIKCWNELTDVCRHLNYDTELIESLESLSFKETVQCATCEPQNDVGSVHEASFKENTANPIQNTRQINIPRLAAQFPVGIPESQSTTVEVPGRQLREYQKDLSQDAIEGKNVIICAPTGSGKTRVASHIIYTRFNSTLKSQNPKIAFIVPRVSLAKQQCDNIKTYFCASGWSIDYLVGDSKATLEDSLRTANVVVMTAQILLNAITTGSVNSLKVFNMIVFDECHHTIKDSPYNSIMVQYLNIKVDKHNGLPQIVGLTATLGVGKGKTDFDAIEHMLMLCANLDATGGIVTVPLTHRDELNKYTPKVEEDSVVLDDNTINDPFTLCLCETIDEMVGILHNMDIHKIKGVTRPQPIAKGSQQYIQWCKDFAAKAIQYLREDSDVNFCRNVQACVSQIQLFNEALDLHFKCRAVDALKYLEAKLSQSHDINLTSVEKNLQQLALKSIEKLKAYYNDPHCANQNLNKMEKEILGTFVNDLDSRAMLNVLRRQYAEPIKGWLNETEALKKLNIRAEYFTGVGKSRDGAAPGLTHSKQEKILEEFRNGNIKILVCTPDVASEGMDIVNCNLVICYDYVKNEISSTQVKGRARKPQGRMVQFSSQSVMAKDKVNISKFLLMEKTTEVVQNMFRTNERKYLDELQKHQNLTICDYRLKQKLSTANPNEMNNSSPFKVRCKKCSIFACMSDNIEVVNGTNHTCITEDFKTKYIERPVEDGGTERKHGLFCKNCDTKWGIFARVRRILIPQLRPEAFKFVDDINPSNDPIMGSKWKSIKIQFKTTSYDDLTERMFLANM
uniref:antiviral innate immune response receptor RIG-I-like n=1 Tax=Styela clava TaxID=7725 RepID=UPI00193A8B78|nr:antiviral innate immune response receptor RIG-I-like [Styela clava]